MSLDRDGERKRNEKWWCWRRWWWWSSGRVASWKEQNNINGEGVTSACEESWSTVRQWWSHAKMLPLSYITVITFSRVWTRTISLFFSPPFYSNFLFSLDPCFWLDTHPSCILCPLHLGLCLWAGWVTSSPHGHGHTVNHSYSPTGNLESPVNLQ